MTSAFDREPPEVPKPEGSDSKEVYAFYGLCAFCAQVLERGLVNLAVVLHARGLSAVTREAVEDAFDWMEERTLGQLISDVRRRVQVSGELEMKLAVALKDRNYLAHRFFSTHDIDFGSLTGRSAMMEELRTMTIRFQQTDQALEAVTLPLWESIGVTKQHLEQEIERMREEVESRDAS